MSEALLKSNFDALSMSVFPEGEYLAGQVFVDKTCDTKLQLFAFRRNGHPTAIRFRARTCPHLLAACELVCKALSELENSTQWPQINSLIGELDIPIEKAGRVLLLEDAIADLAGRLKT
ncbi:MAG: hypothetical protein AAF385_07840 [Pseudomonadota bacterium]